MKNEQHGDHGANTSPTPARKCLSRFAARLALVAGSVIFTLLAMEVGLRAIGAKPKTATVLSTYFSYSSATGWGGRPNAECQFTTSDFDVFVSHDADGLRHCGLDSAIADDARHTSEVVWCLGDSGTWGWGVDDGQTYVDLLNRASDGEYVFRNLGASGFSTAQELCLLKDRFERGQKPARVVILFCVNDLPENLDGRHPPRPYFEVVDGQAELRNSPTPASRRWNFQAWMKTRSLAYNYIDFYGMSAKKRLREWRRKDAAYRSATPFGENEQEWVALREGYRRIGALCDAHEVRFAVANEMEPANLARQRLEKTCRELGIAYLDLSGPWQRNAAAEHPEPTSFKYDPHYNALGHQLLAEGLFHELDAWRMVEASLALRR
ncbi:MAG: hypothetical protein HYX69_15080 [Planctomycetia bacterium]|nr:hypothetical protein [Planctomycetia bacterium]